MSSRSLNKVMLIGNLTRDPELRYTPNGTAVVTFGLATNRSWLPEGAQERREETEFHRIVAWNKLADLCAQLLYKGVKVYVEGRLQTRNWNAQDGASRTTTEVVIDDMIILDKKGDRASRGGQQDGDFGGQNFQNKQTFGTQPVSSKKKTENEELKHEEENKNNEEDLSGNKEDLAPEDIPF